MGATLRESKLDFVDLNYDEIVFVPNQLGMTSMTQLALPATLKQVDLIVSLPKMKTHHWVGVRLTQEPVWRDAGHLLRLAQERLALRGNHSLDPRHRGGGGPHLAIVDGIIGMEGDGPVMGTPRHAGVLVMGTNLPAVDATCARLMKINPWRIGYLAGASGRLGPISERHIEQRGETIHSRSQPFQLLDHPYFAGLRG